MQHETRFQNTFLSVLSLFLSRLVRISSYNNAGQKGWWQESSSSTLSGDLLPRAFHWFATPGSTLSNSISGILEIIVGFPTQLVAMLSEFFIIYFYLLWSWRLKLNVPDQHSLPELISSVHIDFWYLKWFFLGIIVYGCPPIPLKAEAREDNIGNTVIPYLYKTKEYLAVMFSM